MLLALGAMSFGLVWGLVCSTVLVRDRPLVDAAWLVMSTTAVVASAGLMGGQMRWATVAAGGAAAGWLLRRILEAIVEGHRWT